MSTISHRFTSTNRSLTFWHISHNLLASFFVHARPKPSKLAGLVAGIGIEVRFPCLSSVCIRVTADHGISAWSVTDPALSTRASLTACDSLALCIKLPPTVLASRNTTTNTSSALRPQQRLAPRIPSSVQSIHPPILHHHEPRSGLAMGMPRTVSRSAPL